MDDELVDDVFEDCSQLNPTHFHQNTDTGLNMNEATFLYDQTPSPIASICPGFKQHNNVDETDIDDGWKSFKIDDDNKFNDAVTHKAR